MPLAEIHATSVIAPDATLGDGVIIGPYVVIESGARIAARATLMAFTHIAGACDIGEACQVHPGAVLGGAPQVRGHAQAGGGLVIGPRTVIREGVTIHRALHAGMTAEQRRTVAYIYRTMYRSGLNVSQAAIHVGALPPTPERDAWLAAIEASTRGLCAARARGHRS